MLKFTQSLEFLLDERDEVLLEDVLSVVAKLPEIAAIIYRNVYKDPSKPLDKDLSLVKIYLLTVRTLWVGEQAAVQMGEMPSIYRPVAT